MTDPSPDLVWVPVVLGDCRIGDTVRAIPETLPDGSRWASAVGTIVAVRMGFVTVRIDVDSVVFEANQLERLQRPE